MMVCDASPGILDVFNSNVNDVIEGYMKFKLVQRSSAERFSLILDSHQNLFRRSFFGSYVYSCRRPQRQVYAVNAIVIIITKDYEVLV
jgi:hypothetical protein